MGSREHHLRRGAGVERLLYLGAHGRSPGARPKAAKSNSAWAWKVVATLMENRRNSSVITAHRVRAGVLR